MLFDHDRKYNKVFIRYVQEYQEQKESANPESIKLKVDQKTFEEIINYFGDLKRSGKIKNKLTVLETKKVIIRKNIFRIGPFFHSNIISGLNRID